MGLSSLTIQKEYRNLKCDIIHDFYIPILTETIVYKRAVGFFNSAALYEMAIGLNQLVKNGGKIELIVSPHLTDDDIKSIQLGYQKREEIIERALLRNFTAPQTQVEKRKLNLLANLIADGTMDIKVAFKVDAISAGIFHEKIGIVTDSEGNKIAFTGSMNETYSGLLHNYESIDVYCSWREEDAERVSIKEYAFDNLWDNLDTAMEVIEFPKVAIERLNTYKVSPTQEILQTDFEEPTIKEEKGFFKIPKNVKLHPYQEDAINTWVAQDYKGIFDMATGTGKTFTALGALSKLSKDFSSLAVIIVCPYQHLVEQWVEDIEQFNVDPIIAYSNYNWRELFSDAINAYRSGAVKNFCVVVTNATFETDDFQKYINKIKKNLCFIVDEAHNFGATKLSAMMPEHSRFRLALSATIERYRDEEGTNRIKSFFGEKCITFTLEDAIKQGFLTSYYYYPIPVYLTPEELDEYKVITRRIVKLGGGSPENCEKNPAVELLLLRRARIVAGAHNKIAKLLEVIEPYRNDNHMLVYCGATKYDRTDISDNDDVKQIEKVCQLLYEKLQMKVRKFTSEEDKKARQEIKDLFKEGIDLQVIAAIKCLDEGVNIPAIKRAFILASSTNPKEYIQRRGRVLRKFDGKEYAEIFDFITLPRPLDTVEFCSPDDIKSEMSLLKKEFDRMMDFANSARNPFSIDSLKEQILNKYGMYSFNREEF
ncbi:MAG: DEAD/DEAH box helicase family protein [Clostridiales bacterium]|nr:DEAD/DEAH box helicase family protein [Clostridiales bacterium]